jgi:hypothetical protein
LAVRKCPNSCNMIEIKMTTMKPSTPKIIG